MRPTSEAEPRRTRYGPLPGGAKPEEIPNGTEDHRAINAQLAKATGGQITATLGQSSCLISGINGRELSNSQAEQYGQIPDTRPRPAGLRMLSAVPWAPWQSLDRRCQAVYRGGDCLDRFDLGLGSMTCPPLTSARWAKPLRLVQQLVRGTQVVVGPHDGLLRNRSRTVAPPIPRHHPEASDSMPMWPCPAVAKAAGRAQRRHGYGRHWVGISHRFLTDSPADTGLWRICRTPSRTLTCGFGFRRTGRTLSIDLRNRRPGPPTADSNGDSNSSNHRHTSAVASARKHSHFLWRPGDTSGLKSGRSAGRAPRPARPLAGH
jgi:hypothetical protein